MTAIVSFTCSECGRTGKRPAEVLRRDIESGRAACGYCGGGLELPAAFEKQLAAAQDFGGLDPEQELEVGCSACPRTLTLTVANLAERVEKIHTRCPMCGADLVLPEEFQAARAEVEAAPPEVEVRFDCPLCLREIATQPGELPVGCADCGAAVLPPLAPGDPWRVPLAGAAVSPEDASAQAAILGEDPLSELARWALMARAGLGELGEEATLASLVPRLLSYRGDPEDPAFLPLPLEDASALLPEALLPGRIVIRQPGSKRVDLRYDLGVGSEAFGVTPPALQRGLRTVEEILASLPEDHSYASAAEPEPVQVPQAHFLVGLKTRGAGVEVEPWVLFNGNLSRVTGDAEERFYAHLAGLGPSLAGYCVRLLLFGAWAAGPSLLGVSEAALARRLEELGYEDDAAAAAERL